MSTSLQRLVLTFKPEELVVHALCRTDEGPNPGTKARRRGEVSGLAREGLREALSALEGDVAVVGTSGYTTREDIMVANRKESAA